MTTYLYRCAEHGTMILDHPMAEVDREHLCPHCARALRRVLVPIHHRWPSNHRPGLEHSGQRLLLDPEFQVRKKDELAEQKAAHVARTAREQEGSGGNRGE